MKRNTLTLRKDPAILRGQLRAWLDLDDLTERSRPPELQSQALLSLLARMVIGRLMAENRSQVLLTLQHDPAGKYASQHDHKLEFHTDQITTNLA